MAELDPDVVLEALRKKAQDKRLSQRLAVPEFEKDQLRVDQKVKEDGETISGWKIPDQNERNEMGRAVIKKLDETGVSSALKKVDDFGRVLGNPFGIGDALESAMTGKTIDESRAQTAASKENLGRLGGATELTGEIGASIAAAPVTTTIKGAALAGGLTSVIADSAEKVFKEDRLPTLEEAMLSAGLGTGLGALGQVFGNKLARWFTEKGAAKTPITMGAERALKSRVRTLSQAFKFADDSGAMVPAADLHQFIIRTLSDKRLTERLGLHPSVDKAAWNGFNSVKAEVSRLQPGQGFNIQELARIRTGMRDRAAAGAEAGTDLVLELDNAFDKMVSRSLFKSNPKAQKAWEMIGRLEKEKIQGEYLKKILDSAELRSSAGKGPIDKTLQDNFIRLVENPRLMAKLGFTPEQKELFREAAHGTNWTILANKSDRVMGSTFLAPFYRMSLQPILRARGSSRAEDSVLDILGNTLNESKGDIVPPLAQNMGQITAPIAPQLADPVQNAVLPQQNPSAGNVAPSQATGNAPAPNTGPQRMPRPFTPQSRSAVPNLPKP